MSPRPHEPPTPWTAAVVRAVRAVSNIGELAARAGIARQELHRIANGERRATRRVGRAVLRALVRLAADQRHSAALAERHAAALRRALAKRPK